MVASGQKLNLKAWKALLYLTNSSEAGLSRAGAVFYVTVIPVSVWTALLCSAVLVWPHW